ncbi:UNVERIFIED_CONTAM: hypothetical protein RMT77_014799 [Armadillidium vulgare]
MLANTMEELNFGLTEENLFTKLIKSKFPSVIWKKLSDREFKKYGGIEVNEKFEQTFPSVTNGAKIEDYDNHCSSELGNEVCRNVKIFKCSECNKKCKTKGGLKLHINKLHSGAEMFRCSKCSFESYSKYKFDCHMLIHSDKKNYPCCKCDKKFSCKRNLQRHMLVHSDKKKLCMS